MVTSKCRQSWLRGIVLGWRKSGKTEGRMVVGVHVCSRVALCVCFYKCVDGCTIFLPACSVTEKKLLPYQFFLHVPL